MEKVRIEVVHHGKSEIKEVELPEDLLADLYANKEVSFITPEDDLFDLKFHPAPDLHNTPAIAIHKVKLISLNLNNK